MWARENIINALQHQKHGADSHRCDRQYNIGDFVLLKAENLEKKQRNKLSLPFAGPFKVCNKFDNDVYELEVPPRLHIFPKFHASKLKAWKAEDKDEKFIMAEIRGERLTTAGNLEYLVKWAGYNETTWESRDNVLQGEGQDLIDEFKTRWNDRHPRMPTNKRRWEGM